MAMDTHGPMLEKVVWCPLTIMTDARGGAAAVAGEVEFDEAGHGAVVWSCFDSKMLSD